MSFYGKNYRPRSGSGVGFQAPSPNGPNGPRVPGGLAPAPSPARPGKPLFTIPKIPKRIILNLPSPVRQWMQLYRKVKLLQKIAEKYTPELLPYTPPVPRQYLPSPGYAGFYDCPTMEEPYINGAKFRKEAVGASSVSNTYKCLHGQVPDGDVSETQTQRITGRRVMIGPAEWPQDTNGVWRRMGFDKIWVWPASVPAAKAYLDVIPMVPIRYVPSPAPYWTMWPDDAPIFQPSPFPLGLPYRMVPLRPDRGLQPSAAEQGLAPAPYLPPYGDPLAGPAVSTGGGGIKPGEPHVFMPPARGDKEKKHNGGPAAQALQRLMNRVGGPVTEGADAVKAVYDALGKKCKGANTPQAQLQCIYTNWSTLDAGQAVANLIANEAQDRAIGKIGSAVKSVGGKRPGGLKPIGWGTGPAI